MRLSTEAAASYLNDELHVKKYFCEGSRYEQE